MGRKVNFFTGSKSLLSDSIEDEAVAQLFSAEGFVLCFAFMWFDYQGSVFSQCSWEKHILDLSGMQYSSQGGVGGYLQMLNITPALSSA